jgi:hypothetical protein
MESGDQKMGSSLGTWWFWGLVYGLHAPESRRVL